MSFAVIGIICLTALYTWVRQRLFTAWAGWPDFGRIMISVMLIVPLGFCMGIPFPCGLQGLSDRYSAMLPWAQGINGCASVMGASLATLVAIHAGFIVLVQTSAIIYLIAIPAIHRIYRGESHAA